MPLTECVCHILNMLLPNAPITEIISRLLRDSKTKSIISINAIAEYWIWGPCDVNLRIDRQTSLQRYVSQIF